MPGSFLERVEVDVSREELVRLERVSREETLDIQFRQTARIGLEERAASLPGQRRDFHG